MGAPVKATADDERVARRLVVLSSILFFFGSAAIFAYLVLEVTAKSVNAFRKDPIPDYVALAGYSCFAVHALVELALDLSPVRRLYSFGRYGKVYMSSRVYGMDLLKVNLAQSYCFLLASIVQYLAFYYLKNNDLELYVGLNLLSSCLWVVTAALALMARGLFWIFIRSNRRQRLEKTANGLYILMAVIWMLDAVNQMDGFNGKILGDGLQDAAICILFLSGFLYLLVGYRLWCSSGSRIRNVDSSPLNDAVQAAVEEDEGVIQVEITGSKQPTGLDGPGLEEGHVADREEAVEEEPAVALPEPTPITRRSPSRPNDHDVSPPSPPEEEPVASARTVSFSAPPQNSPDRVGLAPTLPPLDADPTLMNASVARTFSGDHVEATLMASSSVDRELEELRAERIKLTNRLRELNEDDVDS